MRNKKRGKVLVEVSGGTISAGELLDLINMGYQQFSGIVAKMSSEEIRATLARGGDDLGRCFRVALKRQRGEATESPALAAWRRVYEKLGLPWNPPPDLVVEERQGFWSIVRLPGITGAMVYEATREKNIFPRYKYINIAEVRDMEDHPIVVYTKETIEPDPHDGKSADDLYVHGPWMNYTERELLGAYVEITLGKDLDQTFWTRCDSSRTASRNVPLVTRATPRRRRGGVQLQHRLSLRALPSSPSFVRRPLPTLTLHPVSCPALCVRARFYIKL